MEQHKIKLVECEETIIKVREKLQSMPKEFEDTYLERYKDGRRKANIPDDNDLSGFMKFMLEPI